jgi:hypothetical protein
MARCWTVIRQGVDLHVAQGREGQRADDGSRAIARAIGTGHLATGRTDVDAGDALALEQVAAEPVGHGHRQLLVAPLVRPEGRGRRTRFGVCDALGAIHFPPVVAEGHGEQRHVVGRGAIGQVGVVTEPDHGVGGTVGSQELMHRDVVLRMHRLVPVLEILERHVLAEHRIGPAPGQELLHVARERVARMSGPGLALHMLAVDEQFLTQAVHDERREVHDVDAVLPSGGDAAAVRRRDGLATDFRMARNVEQGEHAAADALAAFEHQHLEAVLFQRQGRLEAGEACADHDHVRLAVAGGPGTCSTGWPRWRRPWKRRRTRDD